MRLTFLGTGTSFGVPVIGCRCAVCTSKDPRDHRTRHAALLSWDDGRSVLVDTPPELRLQLIREGVERVDAVWYTHLHADHLHGIDDLRIFSLRSRRSVEAYASEDAKAVLTRRFDYIFNPSLRPGQASSKPEICLRTLRAGEIRRIAGADFLPLEAVHGSLRVLGFRLGVLGYLTDAKELPVETFAALSGVDILVLNALWWGNPHPTHLNVEEAVETARQIGARQTYLTHLTHRVPHAELDARLPEGISPAYDGLRIELPDGEP